MVGEAVLWGTGRQSAQKTAAINRRTPNAGATWNAPSGSPKRSAPFIPWNLACRPGGQRGFTMVEIALCIGIIGFALVAIIGVLPAGLQVQRDNREETIINNDVKVLLEAMRGGGKGAVPPVLLANFESIGFSSGGMGVIYTNGPGANEYDTDFEVVGLMSRPSTANDLGRPTTNVIRAFTGALADKGASVGSKQFAFTYRLEVTIDPVFTEYVVAGSSPPVTNRVINASEVQLQFRWPVFDNGGIGQGRKLYRVLVPGILTNDVGNTNLWFFALQKFWP